VMTYVMDDYREFMRAKGTPGIAFRDGYAIYPEWGDVTRRLAESIDGFAPHLHDFQRFAVAFCSARLRAAVFAECGLGKTSIALAWVMNNATGPSIIAAPLAALHEFENERAKFFPGMDLRIVRTGQFDDWLTDPSGVALVTHHAFVQSRDLSGVSAVVLDESSILKSDNGAIAANLVRCCASVPFRLAMSATPAPNDPTEYATHAAWLGYMKSAAEFRARFFIHDGKDWRPKRHADRELPRWMSRFSIWIRDPAAYGMPCERVLPDPYIRSVVPVETPDEAEDIIPRDLFGEADGVMTMTVRSAIRGSLYRCDDRMAEVVRLASTGPSVVWGIRNQHCDDIERAMRQSGVATRQIAGTTSDEDRVAIIRSFQSGEVDCIVSKPKVIGHGVNLQRAEVHVFAGYDESYEAYHQAVRRSHRQGRNGALRVYFVVSPDERRIIESLDAKGKKWDLDASCQEREFAAALKADVDSYHTGKPMDIATEDLVREDPAETEHFRLYHGDCVEVMDTMDPDSMDLAVFSPPFASLFTYSSEKADMGNCSEHGDEEFNIHFHHFAGRLMRVMKPGRCVALHLAQLVAFRSKHGRKGLRDFRGTVIAAMERAGFYYHGEFVIPKNPQAQAIRTKSDRLQFSQFRRNSLESTPSLNDYVLQFKKPGEPDVVVKNDVSNDEWIDWASGVWTGIRETDVLTGWMSARAEEDEKHICPLQLPVIDRCIRLWTNPGEVVFTPFLGIGSEVYQSILRRRKGVGVELKREYFVQAVRNCNRAVAETYGQLELFGS